jgi:hypothetical protein
MGFTVLSRSFNRCRGRIVKRAVLGATVQEIDARMKESLRHNVWW